MTKPDLIYGTRAVMEAIVAGREIERLFIQKGLHNELLRELLRLVRERNISFTYVPVEKLNRLTSKNHQGVVCLLSSVTYASLDNLINFAYSHGREPFFIILDRITDVRNVGAIARTAECAGMDGMIIAEKGSAPVSGDAMKTSAGALNHLPVCREKDLRKTIKFLQDNGIMVIACTEKASKTIYEVAFNRPVALIMGSEEDGISDDLLRTSDELVKIPMRGKIGSLNVSVAAGIAIYEVVRQRILQ
ncbi:MAG: 23S rRNA (guanosine(2251)-2'-O)-methyltransferase RlmB [Cyclobacteriaceae bacterium]|nr:23S rRNA (guanosine(2251)-2'-O)-methyltransferase RlmB [Cyclobacteriaceae bacterium]